MHNDDTPPKIESLTGDIQAIKNSVEEIRANKGADAKKALRSIAKKHGLTIDPKGSDSR